MTIYMTLVDPLLHSSDLCSESMGGCATKPNSILDDLPEERPGSPPQEPRQIQARPTEGADADNTKKVDAEQKEEPLLYLTRQGSNTPKDADQNAESSTAAANLASEASGPKPESAGSEKLPEATEKPRAENTNVDQAKEAEVPNHDSEKLPEAGKPNQQVEVEKQQPSNTNSEKKGVEMPHTSA